MAAAIVVVAAVVARIGLGIAALSRLLTPIADENIIESAMRLA